MKIMIEQLKPGGKSDAAQTYWTFWVRLFTNDMWSTTSGWRYFPANRSVATPSVHKGGNNYHDTLKCSGNMYNEVLRQVESILQITNDVEDLAA